MPARLLASPRRIGRALLRATLAAVLLALATPAPAASTLAPGDIAFVGYNADGTDSFAFVALVDIDAGTAIRFTDNGWNSDQTFRTGEGILAWTAPAGGVTPGTVVEISRTPAVLSGPGSAATVSGSLDFSTSGDQVFAYQGTEATPTMLAGLNNQNSTWQSSSTNSSDSSLPNVLTNGTHAVALVEIDNIAYNCSTVEGTQSELLAAIHTASNWTGHDVNPQVLTNCAFDLGGAPVNAAPAVASFAPAADPVQEGATITLNATWTDADGLSTSWTVNALVDGVPYSQNSTGSPTAFAAIPAGDGPRTVTAYLSVTDDGGLSSTTSTTTIQVENVPPTADAGGPYQVAQNATVTLNGNATDPGPDAISYAWDLDNNGTFETPGQSVSFDATGLPAGPATVVLRATDDDSGVDTDSATVLVLDATAPSSSASAPAFHVGATIPVTFTASDNVAASDTLLWVQEPGSASLAPTGQRLPGASGTFNVTATASGVYRFATQARDDAGNLEAAPSPDATTIVNIAENGALALLLTGNGTLSFPMEGAPNPIVVELDFSGVLGTATITVQRHEGESALADYDDNRLIDQWLTITISDPVGFSFTAAELRLPLDAAQLDGLAESAITIAVRDAGGVLTEHPASATGGLLTVPGITSFSDWYFGDDDATVPGWETLED